MVVLRAGRVVQVGTPEQVYERPVDLDVARLTGPVSLLEAGWPGMPGSLLRAGPDGIPVTLLEAGSAAIPVTLLKAGSAAGVVSPGQALLVRPDWASFGGDTPGFLVHVRYRGPHTDYAVDVAGGSLLIRETGRVRRSAGERVAVSIDRTWPLETAR